MRILRTLQVIKIIKIKNETKNSNTNNNDHNNHKTNKCIDLQHKNEYYTNTHIHKIIRVIAVIPITII